MVEAGSTPQPGVWECCLLTTKPTGGPVVIQLVTKLYLWVILCPEPKVLGNCASVETKCAAPLQ